MTHAEIRGCPRVLCIVAAPRTGSNVLCRMLSRDPSFHCKWELFHPHWIGALNEDELAALAARANSVEAIANWRARQLGAVIDLLLGLNPWYRKSNPVSASPHDDDQVSRCHRRPEDIHRHIYNVNSFSYRWSLHIVGSMPQRGRQNVRHGDRSRPFRHQGHVAYAVRQWCLHGRAAQRLRRPHPGEGSVRGQPHLRPTRALAWRDRVGLVDTARNADSG